MPPDQPVDVARMPSSSGWAWRCRPWHEYRIDSTDEVRRKGDVEATAGVQALVIAEVVVH